MAGRRVFSDIGEVIPFLEAREREIIRTGDRDAVQSFADEVASLADGIEALLEAIPGDWDEWCDMIRQRELLEETMRRVEEERRRLDGSLSDRFGEPSPSAAEPASRPVTPPATPGAAQAAAAPVAAPVAAAASAAPAGHGIRRTRTEPLGELMAEEPDPFAGLEDSWDAGAGDGASGGDGLAMPEGVPDPDSLLAGGGDAPAWGGDVPDAGDEPDWDALGGDDGGDALAWGDAPGGIGGVDGVGGDMPEWDSLGGDEAESGGVAGDRNDVGDGHEGDAIADDDFEMPEPDGIDFEIPDESLAMPEPASDDAMGDEAAGRDATSRDDARDAIGVPDVPQLDADDVFGVPAGGLR